MTTNGRMSLESVRTGPRPAPDRILMHGTEGVGKSSFAAGAPAPVFVAAEDGIRHLDVASFPEPTSYGDVLEAVRVLASEDHEYRTLVVDTVDWLEPLLWDHACRENRWKTIEEPGYGKGYVIVLSEWRRLLAELDALRDKRQMEIVLLAHSGISTFSNPAGPDYSRYEPKLHKKAASLLKEWSDAVLFATYEEEVKDPKGFGRAKGVSTGHRVIHTQRRAAWDAKERYGLPPEIPLSYREYAAAREEKRPRDPAKMWKEAVDLVTSLALDAATREKTESWLKRAREAGPRGLAMAVDTLRAKLAEKEE